MSQASDTEMHDESSLIITTYGNFKFSLFLDERPTTVLTCHIFNGPLCA